MLKGLRISVVMATYNGEKYVKEQIDSILYQTRRPDELLIFDDASTDKTKDIIQSYEKQYDYIKVIMNEKNMGWKTNFAKAITKASGDFIFLADQDDIWTKDKIEKMISVMERDNSIELLASNYIPIYESKKEGKVNSYFYRKYGMGNLVKVRKPKLYCVPFRPGCCYCIKKNLILFFDRLWSENYPHDLILWEIAAFRDSLYIFNEELMFFRRHTGNNTPKNPHDKKGRIEKTVDLLKLINEIENIEAIRLSDYNKKILKNQKKYFTNRIKMINHKTIYNILSTIQFINYYPMYRGFFGDLIAK